MSDDRGPEVTDLAAVADGVAPDGAELGRRRRRRRLVAVGAIGTLLAAAAIVVAVAVAGGSGAKSSGALYSAPYISRFRGCGELGCGTPMFTLEFGVPSGSSAEVNIAVISGCIAFGSQTRSYKLAPGGDVYQLSGGHWYFYWKQSMPFTNICLGSWYRARVRVYDNGWSPWSEWAATQATTLDQVFAD